jgi:hypothetical protein
LGDSRSGHVFDLSEGGLSIDGLSLEIGEVVSLAFDLPSEWVQARARAEIVWTNKSKRRSGLRFLDFADTSRQQVRDWISARFYTAAPATDGTDDVPPGAVTAVIGAVQSPVSDDWGDEEFAQLRNSLVHTNRTLVWKASQLLPIVHEGFGRLSKSRYPIRLILLVILLTPASLFLGYILANRGDKPQAMEMPSIPTKAAPSPNSRPTTVNPPPGTPPALSAALPFNAPGLILQVAAMSHENNANALPESLEERDFPAFVFRRTSSRFYRVAVGPYSDAHAAASMKEQLEEHGFDVIIKSWSPE